MKCIQKSTPDNTKPREDGNKREKTQGELNASVMVSLRYFESLNENQYPVNGNWFSAEC